MASDKKTRGTFFLINTRIQQHILKIIHNVLEEVFMGGAVVLHGDC